MNGPDPSAAGSSPALIGPLLRRAHRRAAQAFVDALKPLGIEGRHYGVLLGLHGRGPLSQRELIDHTGSDKSSMVRTVDALEARGLVVRRPSPTDRRAYAVEITDEGRAVFGDASEIARDVAERLLACLDESDRALFQALLERFVAAEGSE